MTAHTIWVVTQMKMRRFNQMGLPKVQRRAESNCPKADSKCAVHWYAGFPYRPANAFLVVVQESSLSFQQRNDRTVAFLVRQAIGAQPQEGHF